MQKEAISAEQLACIDGHTTAMENLQKEVEKSYGVGDTVVFQMRLPDREVPKLMSWQRRVGIVRATDMSLRNPRPANFAVEVTYEDDRLPAIHMVAHHFIDHGQSKLAQEVLGKNVKNVVPVLVIIED